MKRTLIVYNPANTVLVNGLRYYGLPVDVMRGVRAEPSVVAEYPASFIILTIPDSDTRAATETTVAGYCSES